MSSPESPVVALVVEDDDDLRELLVRTLELEGFIAHGVGSLAAARAALVGVHPDVLVADYGLPDGTGAELLKTGRASRVNILLTGFAADEIDATGFDVVMQKPAGSAELIAAIRLRL